jgi:hypothetical protein
LALVLALAACSQPLPPAGFADSGPNFDPVAFFTGHVASWGVRENSGGAPVAIVTTDCNGAGTGPGQIRMIQVLRVGSSKPQTRIWQLRRISPSSYVATANDMAGEADATVSGRALHWRWILRASPGNPLLNVTMEQWMYQMADGGVVIRTVITKLGFRVAQVTEQFEKQPG